MQTGSQTPRLSLRQLGKVALAMLIMAALATSLWLSAPASALTVTITDPYPLNLGANVSFNITVTVETGETLPINNVKLEIYNADGLENTYKATADNLTVTDNIQSFPAEQTGGGDIYVTTDASDTWGSGYSDNRSVAWQGYAYLFGTGYGYRYLGGSGNTTLTYSVIWGAPSSWPQGTYAARITITNATTTFTQLRGFSLAAVSSGVGGGAAPSPTPTPTPGVTSLSTYITSTGTFNYEVVARSADSQASVYISTGTVGLTSSGTALSSLTITPVSDAERPAPPTGANHVAVAYTFGPDGATFNPPITMTLTYNPTLLPAGVPESSLAIAWWNSSSGRWETLSSTVYTSSHTISAPVSHFTQFSVISLPQPASFIVSPLTIAPPSVLAGQPVTIATTVTNTGGQAGSYNVTLKVNNLAVSSQSVTLAPGTNQRVTFTNSQVIAGTYTVDVNGQPGNFMVNLVPTPTPTLTPTTTPASTPSPTPKPTLTPTPIPTPPSEGPPWLLIGGIAAGVIVIAVLVIIYLRRRAYYYY